MVGLNPNAWIRAKAEKAGNKHPLLRFFIFFAIGFYGGFIQIGVGFFLLAGLVLGCGFDLLKANARKNIFSTLLYPHRFSYFYILRPDRLESRLDTCLW